MFFGSSEPLLIKAMCKDEENNQFVLEQEIMVSLNQDMNDTMNDTMNETMPMQFI